MAIAVVIALVLIALFVRWQKGPRFISPPPRVKVGVPAVPAKIAAPPRGQRQADPPRLRYVIKTEHGQKSVALLPGTGRGYFVEVHGESNYQEALREFNDTTERGEEVGVRLTAEPNNSYDPNAVAVQTFDGKTLGYLTQEDAPRYQQLALQLEAKGLIGICSARLSGGTNAKPNVGIYLDIEAPTIVAKKLDLQYKRVSGRQAEPTGPSTESPPRRPRRKSAGGTRIDQLPIDDASSTDVGTGHGCSIAIVGESYRQVALRELSGGRRARGEEVHITVTLRPEPTNPYDPNAVRVDIVNGAQVGYLAKDDAAIYLPVLQAIAAGGKRAVCRAKLIGGTDDKPSIGAIIDLDEPAALLARAPGGQPF